MSERARVALCVARFYTELAERLETGARAALGEAGVNDVEVFEVPGAYELPLAAYYAANSGRFDAVVCLGAVIRGETDHYDYVAGEAAGGVARAALATGVPVIFGILTCDTLEQALDRAGAKGGNKGFDAALTAVEMVNLFRQLPK